MHKHPDTHLRLEQLGTIIPPYKPTYEIPGPTIDEFHAALAHTPPGNLVQLRKGAAEGGGVIEGWLRPEDALKLYEMAYFATGNILELGSFHGLSTTILATACRNSSWPKRFTSVDLDPACVAQTMRTLQSLGLEGAISIMCADGSDAMRSLLAGGPNFAFVFVDHSHAYEPVLAVCHLLHRVITSGGFCLFHDYNDVRNADSTDQAYGVYQAVNDGLSPAEFEFYGIYGCTALFRKH